MFKVILFSSIRYIKHTRTLGHLIVETLAGTWSVKPWQNYSYRKKVLCGETTGSKEIQISLTGGSILATERKSTQWKQSNLSFKGIARSLSSEKSNSGKVRVPVVATYDISGYLSLVDVILEYGNHSSSGNPVHELESSPLFFHCAWLLEIAVISKVCRGHVGRRRRRFPLVRLIENDSARRGRSASRDYAIPTSIPLFRFCKEQTATESRLHPRFTRPSFVVIDLFSVQDSSLTLLQNDRDPAERSRCFVLPAGIPIEKEKVNALISYDRTRCL